MAADSPVSDAPDPAISLPVAPLFLLDVRDRLTGKQVAVRLSRAEALLPLGRLLGSVLRAEPETLVSDGRIAAEAVDTFFRLQDLLFPVRDDGTLAPDAAPYAGIVWRHQREGFALDPAAPARFERLRRTGVPDVLLLTIDADRLALRYERTWRGFHTRRFRRFRPAIDRLLRPLFPDGVALAGAAAEARFVEAVARRIWEADFENYSKFLPPWPPPRLKSGDETITSIAAGYGGVCTEKVLALKLITDGFGLESRVIFAGPFTGEPLPVAPLREMLDELERYDFTYSRRYLRFWDHVALEYRLSGGITLLVDPSNGNIPFLCAPSGAYLDGPEEHRRVVPVRMLAVEEPVTYHRPPEQLGLDFLFAWETWIEDVDLLQVFDNHIGLLTAAEFYITPVLSGSAEKRRRALDGWRAYARTHGLGAAVWPGDGNGSDANEGGIDGLVAPGDGALIQAFARAHPRAAAACRAALPGLERRYREHILTRFGVDKPFRADLAVLDRRPLIAAGAGEAAVETPA